MSAVQNHVGVVDRVNHLVHQPDLGLLLVRLMVGVVGIYHGGQKLFGAFDGMGIDGFTGFLTSLGVPAPHLSAYLAGGAEFFGGLLILTGILTRLAAIPFAITMLTAILTVHLGKFNAGTGGMEYPLTLLVIAVSLALTGPGRLTVPALVRALRGQPATGRNAVLA